MGHRQSDQHWNCFKGNTGENPERRGRAHMGLPERIYDTTLNRTELLPNTAYRIPIRLPIYIVEYKTHNMHIAQT